MSAGAGASRGIFDFSLAVAVTSSIGKFLVGDWEGALRFLIIALSMVRARTSAVPVPFAAAFAVLLLPATWASAQNWYRQIDHFDVVVHLFTPGAVAAVFYFTLVSGTVALLWECYEWVIQQVTPKTIVVGYSDSISDMLAGLVGSVLAGALVVAWARRTNDPACR